ncbi:MAG: hypothetical protein SFX72_16130 [Isosphaeraceae bacterium]|nr:hypothetical protein [Isosphaeraceae bacterium]
MKNRRAFLSSLTVAFVALGIVAGSALADELLGVLKSVDVENSKITVIPKGSEKEVVVTITDKTEQVTKKGATPVKLKGLVKALEKATDAGKKVQIKVEHENAVATKIQLGGAPKKKSDN